MAEGQKLSKEGFRKLELELEELKTVKRKEVSEKIKVALGFGDLSENSEYDAAKNEQAMVEARIAQIEHILNTAEVLKEDQLTDQHVAVGTTVKVQMTKETGECQTRSFKITSTTEANLAEGSISDESPIGAGLIGAVEGETRVVKVPAGNLTLKVLDIHVAR